MSKLIPGNHKHLSLSDRQFIEQSLNEGRSFREISRYLCKDPSTISREVWKHRTVNSWNRGSFNNPYNFCVHRYRCKKTNACSKLIICDTLCRSCHKCNSVCPRFEREYCPRIEKAPFVCNGCDMPRNRCPIHTKYDYHASSAHRHYTECLSSSRAGVNLTGHQWRSIDRVVRPLVEQGQSPYMIIAGHPELGISVKTLYNYIEQGQLLVRNVDLKRKVKFKPRKCRKTQIIDREVFQGRTYQDFRDACADESHYAQMDTVVSAKGSGKCILTFYFPETHLFLAFLLERRTPGAVRAVFDRLQKALGDAMEFNIFFECVLTDRGTEFGRPDDLENDREGNHRTNIYYCDPMRSNQKAGIENIHTMLRMILPKGTVFEWLTQWDIRKCVDHINNAPRQCLNGRTPYEVAIKTYGPELLKKLQLRFVAPDEVTLSPKLLRN